MTSASFRDSMNSLGWSRRDRDAPVNTASSSPFLSRIQFLNPFGSGGYVSLPTHEGPGAPLPAPSRREEEEGFFTRTCKVLCCFPLPCDGMSRTCVGVFVTRGDHAVNCFSECFSRSTDICTIPNPVLPALARDRSKPAEGLRLERPLIKLRRLMMHCQGCLHVPKLWNPIC